MPARRRFSPGVPTACGCGERVGIVFFTRVLLRQAMRRARFRRGGRNCSMFRNASGREVGQKMNLQFGGFPILVTVLLSICGFFVSAGLSNAEEEPGTSLTLARLRSAQISNLSYQTRFSIPRSSNEPIR